VIWEAINVFRHYELHSIAGGIDGANLENFHIVAHHVRSQLKGTHIYNVDVSILNREDSAEL